jgi:tRNA threonylcarbamoyladenosine biosynthesis protein TsaB
LAEKVNILAFDTSTHACSVAIQCRDEIKCISKVAAMQQGQFILPLIKELLDHFSLTVNQLDAIAFGSGPGSLTGIRMSSCVAQGLAFPFSIPVVPISSMAALAQTVYIAKQWPRIFIALDARTDQVYWAMYEIQNNLMSLLGQEIICPPESIIFPDSSQDIDYSSFFAAGEGWEKYQNRLIMTLGYQPKLIESSWLPTAEAVLILAKHKLEINDWVSAFDAMPTYLR